MIDKSTIVQTYAKDNDIHPLAYAPGDGVYTIEDAYYTKNVSPNKALSFPEDRPTLQLESRKISFTSNLLGHTVKVYKTQDIQDVKDLCEYYADWGFSYDIDIGGTPWITVTVHVPYDEITNEDWNIALAASENWEILPKSGIKDIMNSPFIIAGMGLTGGIYANQTTIDIPSDLKPLILQAYDQKLQTIAYFPTTGSADYSPWVPIANTVLALKNAKVQGIPLFGHTLKRTACVDKDNTTGAFKTEFDNYMRGMANNNGAVNFCLTKTAMVEQFDIPDSVVVFMVSAYAKYLITDGNIGGLRIKKYGTYLAKLPTIQYVSHNKMIITQEFEFDEWMENGYFIVTGDGETLSDINTV